VISLFFTWFYSLFYLKIKFIKFFPKILQIRKLLQFSGFLGLQKIFITMSSRLDMLMLVPLAGNLSAGIYGAASRILQIYPFFISGFGLVTAPKYAEFSDHRKALRFFYKTLTVVFIFLMSIIFLYIFAPVGVLVLRGSMPSFLEVLEPVLEIFAIPLILIAHFSYCYLLACFSVFLIEKTKASKISIH